MIVFKRKMSKNVCVCVYVCMHVCVCMCVCVLQSHYISFWIMMNLRNVSSSSSRKGGEGVLAKNSLIEASAEVSFLFPSNADILSMKLSRIVSTKDYSGGPPEPTLYCDML